MSNFKNAFAPCLLGGFTVVLLSVPLEAADPPGKAISWERLQQLPESQVIESKGKRVTVGEVKKLLRADFEKAAAKAKTARTESQAKLTALQSKLTTGRKAKFDADRGKALAEVSRLEQAGGSTQGSPREAIEKEAQQLYQRSKTASAAEKAQIDKRANELLRQLER